MEQKKLVKPIELTLVTAAGQSHQILMAHSPMVIGRHESCDIVLNSRSVSRLHCQLKLKSFGLTVKDLESRNGTFLDDVQIASKERVSIKEGSVLKIGRFRLRVDRVFNEVEIAEGAALLLGPQREPVEASSPAGNIEPDALLAQLEQFIVHAHEKRRPQNHQPAGAAENLPQGDPSSTASLQHSKSPSSPSISPEDTVLNKTHETKLSGPSSHGQTLFESEEGELDENEQQRLKLREQLDAMKPRDSKEAAIQALRNLFGHR